MSAIQRLCELLDERGIKYELDVFGSGHRATFSINYCEDCNDYLTRIYVIGSCISVERSYLTPEQVIAATLPESDAGMAFDEQRYSKTFRLLEEALTTMSEWGTSSD